MTIKIFGAFRFYRVLRINRHFHTRRNWLFVNEWSSLFCSRNDPFVMRTTSSAKDHNIQIFVKIYKSFYRISLSPSCNDGDVGQKLIESRKKKTSTTPFEFSAPVSLPPYLLNNFSHAMIFCQQCSFTALWIATVEGMSSSLAPSHPFRLIAL